MTKEKESCKGGILQVLDADKFCDEKVSILALTVQTNVNAVEFDCREQCAEASKAVRWFEG